MCLNQRDGSSFDFNGCCCHGDSGVQMGRILSFFLVGSFICFSGFSLFSEIESFPCDSFLFLSLRAQISDDLEKNDAGSIEGS